jgi:hypothetical protein
MAADTPVMFRLFVPVLLAASVLAGCAGGSDNAPPPSTTAAAAAAAPQTQATAGPQPVFVMAQVVAVDATALTLTVRPSSGATSGAAEPQRTAASPTEGGTATAPAGQTSTLAVDASARERLRDLKAGDRVSLTCNTTGVNSSAGDGSAASTAAAPGTDFTKCLTVMSVTMTGGAAR